MNFVEFRIVDGNKVTVRVSEIVALVEIKERVTEVITSCERFVVSGSYNAITERILGKPSNKDDRPSKATE